MLSLFSGIGSPEVALNKLDINYNVVNYCEIDKHASECYSKIHNVDEDKNLWDITKVNVTHLKGKIDLLVGGSPCQSFSIAGRYQDGSMFKCLKCGEEYNPLLVHYKHRSKCPICNSTNLEGTYSSLIIEYLNVVKESMPKYIVYENVKALAGKRYKEGFDAFILELKDYGYNIQYKVLNSKDYGMPQSRERVFVVGSLENNDFQFPAPVELTSGVQDYIDFREKDNITNTIFNRYKKIHGDVCFSTFVEYIDNLKVRSGIGVKVMDLYNFNEMNTINMPNGLVGTLSRRGVQNNAKKFWYNNQLYKPSPRMCFRLMGFNDDIFDKVKDVGTDSQLWDRAGNSIVVNTIEAIFNELFKSYM